MDLQLNGKRALVTGGSKGIGRAIAIQLALEGAELTGRSGDLASARRAAMLPRVTLMGLSALWPNLKIDETPWRNTPAHPSNPVNEIR